MVRACRAKQEAEAHVPGSIVASEDHKGVIRNPSPVQRLHDNAHAVVDLRHCVLEVALTSGVPKASAAVLGHMHMGEGGVEEEGLASSRRLFDEG